MNLFNIRKAFEDKRKKNWTKLFFCIDLHDVVIEGKYNRLNKGAKIFPHVKKFFKWASKREDIVLILWTSSHDDAITHTLKMLKSHGIVFDYHNENPECPNTELCNFKSKFYFNILFEDKSGFEGKTDWFYIIEELKQIGEW